MSKWARNRNAVELIPRNSKQICPKRNPMKNSLVILLVLTSALHADKKPQRNVSVVDMPPSTGIKTDVGRHLIIESSGIKTVFLDSWPPSDIYRDRGKSSPKNAPSALIIKSLDPLVRSGEIKIKKPPLTPEQRAERPRRFRESGDGFIDSNNSSGPDIETEHSK